MPRLGADMTAGKVVKWLKRPGEQIKRGEVIAIVETDKANVDVESFVAGVLEKILVEPGDERLPVGTPLALIRAEGAAEPAAPAAPVAAARAVTPAPIPSAAIPPAAVPAAVVSPAAIQAAVPSAAAAGERARISPAARKRALELRLDPAALTGTGPEGRVTLADVERAAQAAQPVPATQVAPTAQAAPAARAEPSPADAAAARQLRMREAIANSMSRSKREIPHYYLACTIDMGRAMAWLAERNAGRTVTDRLIYAVLLIKAAALALREVPELNGFWIDNRAQQSEAIHAGIAISLRGGGLVAPALHHADQRSLDDLMRGFQDLVKRARAWSLKSSEMADPTVTITSLGERGVESVFGIITPPQLALVGFGTPLERPWVVGGQVVPRPLITATLSGDHRATDGHRGALFLAAVDRLLQQPEGL
jgi:pyruvate dehydrogenase E2 component (dihydrolipoamide acetyltransferase)